MKAPDQRIEKACGIKDARKYLNQPHFDGKRIIASDGRIMAVIRAEDLQDQDQAGTVPVEALKAARKSGTRHCPGHLIVNGSVQIPLAGITMPREQVDGFPDAGKIASTIKRARQAKRTKMKVSLDVELLLNLAKAIGQGKYANLVTLHIPESINDPVFVEANGGYGVIMQVRT